ncbi:glutamate--tRNA ligase [Candidatus Micrarchaeota archaeon]|nr:glutamate--tRNA ligase [Candidatus Micrarchaeota archaeon]
MELEEAMDKYILKNIYDYGKADVGSVMGKLLAEFPEERKHAKQLLPKIKERIDRFSKLPKEEIERNLSAYSFEKKKTEKKKILDTNGKAVTRFPPEPSGYPHIGHAKACFLNYIIAKENNGEMILRFDDTNPEKEKQEYVDAIKKGLEWLGIKHSKETYTSDNIPLFYEYIEKFFSSGKAYVCTCSAGGISQSREKGIPCSCRILSPEENLMRWKGMLAGKYEAGTAIVRFKGNLKSDNTAMRDPTLFRIIQKPHYRQGSRYTIWPSYDFSVSIMDSIEGVTHAIRTKEYELRRELYFAILKTLELREPELIEISRLSIKNAPISKRLITPLVEEGKVVGWDDPRLPTLAGLKRRGILPEAIKNFVTAAGLSKAESEPEWERLLTENRKLLDEKAERYFFVLDPILLEVEGAPEKEIKLKKHPSKDLGFRTVNITNRFYVPSEELVSLKDGEDFRLKGLYNVKILMKEGKLFKGIYNGEEIKPNKKIQWLPESTYSECTLWHMADLLKNGEYNPDSLKEQKGYCEITVKELPLGSVIQFERCGFYILDSKEPLRFIHSA